MKIILFEDKYRDDMIYMVLNAKNAIGRIPRINEDLLDIKTNYFDKGQSFWLAIDENDRVIGCIGTKERNGNLFLSHLSVKYDLKRNGSGSKLVELAENSARDKARRELAGILTNEIEDMKKRKVTTYGGSKYARGSDGSRQYVYDVQIRNAHRK